MATAVSVVSQNEQLAVIKKRIAELEEKGRGATARREKEHEVLLKETEKRGEMIERLADPMVGEKQASEVNKALDAADNAIRASGRVIEVQDVLLEKVATELARLRAEFNALTREIEEQERVQKFEAAKQRISKKLAETGELLINSRLGLGDLVMDMYSLSEDFGPEASRFLTAETERFFSRQHMSNQGFSEVTGWNGGQFRFFIVPMRKALQ